jgi:hypothetical protein
VGLVKFGSPAFPIKSMLRGGSDISSLYFSDDGGCVGSSIESDPKVIDTVRAGHAIPKRFISQSDKSAQKITIKKSLQIASSLIFE